MIDEEVLEDDAAVLDSDYDDEETAPVEEENQQEGSGHMRAVLEGMLFVTGDEGITLAKAAEVTGCTEEECEKMFDELQQFYQSEDRGIEIERYGTVYRFLSKGFVHEYAKKMFQLDSASRLSNAAMETLAIIAYKQPVTRVEIEEIRGVGADMMLRKLQARGLIKEDGRSEAAGRPILYSVTEEFMDAFSLLSLDELPEIPEFDKENAEEGELFTQ